MSKYEFMHFGASVTLDYIAAELSKLIDAEVVAFSQSPYGMTVLIKTAPTAKEADAPAPQQEEQNQP